MLLLWKLSHFIKKCYKKKNESNKKRFDDWKVALACNKNKLEDDLVLVNIEKKLNDEWILDSG